MHGSNEEVRPWQHVKEEHQQSRCRTPILPEHSVESAYLREVGCKIPETWPTKSSKQLHTLSKVCVIALNFLTSNLACKLLLY